ncbi:CBF/Mak21 family-domain-containing protein [Ochromonadaceae sp. CCMP2298]|nr:CBF/Mak21 family-domain-containing protein [Ochromonadaceae sp. CCMP2298]
MSMEGVQQVRDLERSVKSDPKAANDIIALRKIVADDSKAADTRIAAVNALRRIFIHYVESNWSRRAVPKSAAAAKKANEFNSWFQGQFGTYKSVLIQLATHDNDSFQAVSIRSYIEMMKLDSAVADGPTAKPVFNMESWKNLLVALLVSQKELDVDLLLMLREEILSLHDCLYFAYIAVTDLTLEIKDMIRQSSDAILSSGKANDTASSIVSNIDIIRKNIFDFLRVSGLPQSIDLDNFLVPLSKGGAAEEDSEAEEESDDEVDAEKVKQQRKEALLDKMDPLLAELAGLKRGAPASKGASKKRRGEVSLTDKLMDVEFYRRSFSKAWLACLGLPFTPAQHKLILKHLPEHVVPSLRNPMLLADYLTQSYRVGGVVAVLALESLFHLIMHNNLDYPDFFRSLYRLCTVEVFSAKYRLTFMKLLNASLKSVNIPAYVVAAFVKRLAHLALHTPSPNAPFCIAQCTWLLRQHPQTQTLIHRKRGGDFDNAEEEDLEKAGAMQSSLWEMELLQSHHWAKAASLAEGLTHNESTIIGAAAGKYYVHMPEHMAPSYADVLEDNQKGKKARNFAMSYVKPEALLPNGGLIANHFSTG